MHKFIEEKDWQGSAEALARHALEWDENRPHWRSIV